MLDHLTWALALHRDVGDQRNELNVARAIAAVHRDAGRHAAALDGADTTPAIAATSAKAIWKPRPFIGLSTVHTRRTSPTRRWPAARDARAIARAAGYRLLEGQSLAAIATADRDPGQAELALDILTDAGSAAADPVRELLQALRQ